MPHEHVTLRQLQFLGLLGHVPGHLDLPHIAHGHVGLEFGLSTRVVIDLVVRQDIRVCMFFLAATVHGSNGDPVQSMVRARVFGELLGGALCFWGG